MKPRLPLLILLAVLIGIPLLGMISSQVPTALTRVSSGQAASLTMGAAVAPMPATGPMLSRDIATEKIAIDSSYNGGFVPPMPIGGDGFVAGEDRAIVKTANLTAIVENVRDTVTKIEAATKEVQGYVTNTNIFDEQLGKGSASANITLRVPADQLDAVLVKIRGFATRIVNESVTASDQTKQKVDMEAQLRNLKATETQLLALMKDAKNVTETLAVQRELNQTQQQIERMAAQLQNLNTDVSMSSVSVQLQTKEAEASYQQDSILDEIKISVRDAVQLYRALFIAGIRNLILLAPVLAVGIVGWYLWHRHQLKKTV